ncbi:SigE family RNA polymerase sigma factor [Kribbella solani]|uniref:RNA polymerase sigma-70 factor (Sigma-E family) n=1 Tax=Kribbella solani TaxID=236067 RepID=A0A841DNT2_9ACTN|nr:RNA polymerase sigma-70 factor (sigma-E family) [Kribbella solani]MDX3006684.1 SigE family RNA polymerase sigma factor [Kribbella solani]
MTNLVVSIERPHRVEAADEARDAVSALYGREWRGLVRLAVLVIDDRQTAEDIVQEAFAQLYRRWPLKDSDKALGYLRTTVLNGSRSTLRRRRVARLYTPPHQAPHDSAESSAVLGEERLQVRQALQALPTRSREVLVLRYYLDLPFEEIADILGISASTARATGSRGLAALTKKLEEHR